MVFSDKNLRDFGWNVVGTNLGALRSLNTILATPDADVADSTAFNVSFTSGISVMIRLPSVYLRCSQLSGGCIAEDGSRDVVKRIPITTDMGGLQTAEMSALTPADYLSCSNKVIKGLDFRLTSADGTHLEMGGDVSFSLVFLAKRPM